MKRGSMTKPIPPKQRQEMSEDPFYDECCVADGECSGVIQWHHNHKWQGKRTNEKFGILPVCEYHHRKEAIIKDNLDWVMLNRMSDTELVSYSKAINLKDKKQLLNKRYGNT